MEKLLRFDFFLEKLQKDFPPSKPVKVVRKKTSYDPTSKARNIGECYNKQNYFYIRINPDYPLCVQKETLIHEWAHCLSDWDFGDNDPHTDEWGINYARIYRAMV